MTFDGYTPLADCVRLDFIREDGSLHTVNVYSEDDLDHAPDAARADVALLLESILAQRLAIEAGE